MAQSVIENADKYTNLTASAVVHGGAGKLIGIFVASASSTPTIKVWDNTAASGSVIVNTFTPAATGFYAMPCKFNTGLYVTIGGTVDCTVFSESA